MSGPAKSSNYSISTTAVLHVKRDPPTRRSPRKTNKAPVPDGPGRQTRATWLRCICQNTADSICPISVYFLIDFREYQDQLNVKIQFVHQMF